MKLTTCNYRSMALFLFFKNSIEKQRRLTQELFRDVAFLLFYYLSLSWWGTSRLRFFKLRGGEKYF